MAHLGERILDWAATVGAVGGVYGSLVVFDVVQRVAIRFGTNAHQRAVTGMAVACNRATWLAGTTTRGEGLEHVDPSKSYIVVSNHQSLLDISLCSEYLGALRPRYVSKRELARGVPGVSYNLNRGGSALIDRKDPAQAVAAIADLGRRMREEGFSVVIFPEGTRSKTGAMKPFRGSGLRTLIQSARGLDVLPVTISGGSRLFRHGLKPIVRGVDLVLRVHPAVTPPDPGDAAAFSAFVKRLEETIASALPPEDREGRA